VRLLRIVGKGVLLAAHMALGALLGALLARLSAREPGEYFAMRWCRVAASILRLRVRAVGRPTSLPALYVANHVSWLEAIALAAAAPLGFVAKDDIRRWPVIGSLAAASDALFLRRGSARAAAHVTEAATLRLSEGRSVAVFPEGTSTDGSSVLAFKAALFDAPARLGCEVQPVAVSFPLAPGARAVAPFIGDDEFVPHLLRVLAEPEILLELDFAPALSGHGRSREELAHAARAAIVARLEARSGRASGQFRSGERSFAAP
jgi:1-acyl-sn-glycerol-3-phosphate acyltransferase